MLIIRGNEKMIGREDGLDKKVLRKGEIFKLRKKVKKSSFDKNGRGERVH